MASIILPHEWRSQPQVPVGINKENTLTQGLAFSFLPQDRKYLSGSISGLEASKVGVGAKFDGSTTGLYTRNLQGVNSFYPLTMAVLSKGASLTGTNTLIGLGTDTNNHYVTLDISGTESGDPIRVSAASGTSNYKLRYFSSAGLLDEYHLFVGTYSSAIDYNLYVDGVLKSETSNTGVGTPAPVIATIDIGASYQASLKNIHTGNIALGAIWNRVLSVEEIKNLSNNPWQIFAPIQRKIWIPSTGGGATTHTTTGVLSGQGSTVSGVAARTRVHATTGVLSGQGSTVAGTAIYNAVHGTSGSLSGQGAVVDGVSTRYRLHTTSGVLSGGEASITGSASRNAAAVTHSTSGALVAQGSILSGTAVYNASHSTSGTLTGQGSIIVGAASNAGTLTLSQADIDAIATAVYAKFVAEVYTDDIATAVWQKQLPL